MNSPLQGGQMRRGRRGRRPGQGNATREVPPRAVRLLRLVLVLFVIATATAAWVIADQRGSATPPTAVIHQPGDLGPSPTAEPVTAPRSGISLIGAKPIRPHLQALPRAGLVFDMRSGQVLWAHRPLKRLPIASLTKIMTAIIVVERTRPHERARVTAEALNYSGSGVGVLPRGRMVPVEGLLAGMLLPSGNDAAIALADHIAGHDWAFAQLMNARARALRLGCTRYVSSYGLEKGNRSCAADLAVLARIAMGKPRIARIVRQRQAKVRFPIRSGYLYVNSTNPLLHAHFPGTIGLKTGSTLEAGHCFVGVVRRGHRTIGVVLLNSPNPMMQAEKLVTAAFKLRP
jgi:serine-type D-Ala-D-Ala carboxypeptidase (penicillin-binding protein 5/6)